MSNQGHKLFAKQRKECINIMLGNKQSLKH